jgi:hypothetical protein
MAAVISRALADLKKNRKAIKASYHVRDEAMAWINGPDCEAFCYALDTDYKAIREQAAALYRRFQEEADGGGKSPDRPRKPGAGYRRTAVSLTCSSASRSASIKPSIKPRT